MDLELYKQNISTYNFLGKYLKVDNDRIYNGFQKMFGSYIDKREYSFPHGKITDQLQQLGVAIQTLH